MAVHFSEASVAAEPFGVRASRQRLLTRERVAGTRVLLERWTLGANATAPLEVPAANLAWLQMLDGEATLISAGGETALSASHVVFLPPRFRGTMTSEGGATLLGAEVPEASAIDPRLATDPPPMRVVDWTREPLLDSEHDARKRIYLVTPQLFGTHAIKGEMIIYPPGTEGANHHHEGAEHFMYVIRGGGTVWANESPFEVRAGDLIWYADLERHYLRSHGDGEMVFSEFFVPGEYRTVWAEGAPVCTWLATGRDIEGRRPVREIRSHSSALGTPADV